MKQNIPDVLFVAKLQFFSYIMVPYLTCFQGDDPMIPFLCGDAKRLLQIIVVLRVLADVADSALFLLNIDLDEEKNLLPVKNIHLGFGAEADVMKHNKSPAEKDAVTTLHSHAREFVIGTCDKLAEKSPMGSAIVRCANCFNPKVMVHDKVTNLQNKVKKLSQKIVSLNIIKFTLADKALSQYSELLDTDIVEQKDKFTKFDRKQCLDGFFFKTLKVGERYPNLATLMKVVFTWPSQCGAWLQ